MNIRFAIFVQPPHGEIYDETPHKFGTQNAMQFICLLSAAVTLTPFFLCNSDFIGFCDLDKFLG